MFAYVCLWQLLVLINNFNISQHTTADRDFKSHLQETCVDSISHIIHSFSILILFFFCFFSHCMLPQQAFAPQWSKFCSVKSASPWDHVRGIKFGPSFSLQSQAAKALLHRAVFAIYKKCISVERVVSPNCTRLDTVLTWVVSSKTYQVCRLDECFWRYLSNRQTDRQKKRTMKWYFLCNLIIGW